MIGKKGCPMYKFKSLEYQDYNSTPEWQVWTNAVERAEKVTGLRLSGDPQHLFRLWSRSSSLYWVWGCECIRVSHGNEQRWKIINNFNNPLRPLRESERESLRMIFGRWWGSGLTDSEAINLLIKQIIECSVDLTVRQLFGWSWSLAFTMNTKES